MDVPVPTLEGRAALAVYYGPPGPAALQALGRHACVAVQAGLYSLSRIHIAYATLQAAIEYAVCCLKKKTKPTQERNLSFEWMA
ncbi:hypothetical protein [Deinococcus sp. ME38]|uniref:hypothetical protein n=1 Tax=Deinococcus sp. ME38 TaxID=3400344 RepID=UPI003B5BB179